MKNLISIIFVLFIWSNVQSQIALQDSTYLAKVPGFSAAGIFHNMNGELAFKSVFNQTHIRLNPNSGRIDLTRGFLFASSDTANIFSVNLGILGSNTGEQWNVAVAGFTPIDTFSSNAGYFGGDVNIQGSLYFTSDRYLKKDIQSIDGALDKILKLEPTTYEYLEGYNLAKGKQTGFIAQELKEEFPHLVQKQNMFLLNEKGQPNGQTMEYQGINYIGLIAILTKGIQEQQYILEDQEYRIQELELQLKRLLAQQQSTNKSETKTQVDFFLGQNFPNPTQQITTIKYQIPPEIKNAFIILKNVEGKELQRMQISSGSIQQVTFNMQDIAKGIYFYSLVADGEILETKKMNVNL